LTRKAEIGLVPGLDLAGQRHLLPPFLQFHGDGAHRPDRCRGGFFFLLTGRQNQQQNESTDLAQRKRGPLGRVLLEQICSIHHWHITGSGWPLKGR
jgi:hypothetical protein